MRSPLAATTFIVATLLVLGAAQSRAQEAARQQVPGVELPFGTRPKTQEVRDWINNHPQEGRKEAIAVFYEQVGILFLDKTRKQPKYKPPGISDDDTREFGIDPDKIAVGGGSAGGCMAAAVATVDAARFAELGFVGKGEDPTIDTNVSAMILYNPFLDFFEPTHPRQIEEECLYEVPAIARWPGKVPAGVTNQSFATTMDLFVTFAKLAGAKVPSDRPIDGRDISSLLFESVSSREAEMFYYFGAELWAVRKGPWKIHVKTTSPASVSTWGDWPIEEHDPPLLFNVEHDPSEKYNVADQHPEVAERLLKFMQQHQASIVPGKPQR